MWWELAACFIECTSVVVIIALTVTTTCFLALFSISFVLLILTYGFNMTAVSLLKITGNFGQRITVYRWADYCTIQIAYARFVGWDENVQERVTSPALKLNSLSSDLGSLLNSVTMSSKVGDTFSGKSPKISKPIAIPPVKWSLHFNYKHKQFHNVPFFATFLNWKVKVSNKLDGN